MIYKEYKNNSFNLYTIKTDRFRTCFLDIIFYNKVDGNLVTKENVLASMLQHSNGKYQKRKFVVEHLEDLYNAQFYSSKVRIGNVRAICFTLNFLDPTYTDKNYLNDVIKFPFDMIFNPNINNDEFDERTLKIIKSRIKANIDSVKEAPVRYAIKQAIKNFDKKSPAAIEMEGNIKDLNKISSENLVDFYKYMLDNYYCDIYLVGNLNMDKVNLMIKDLFKNDIIKTDKFDYIINNNITNKKDVVEKDNYDQSTLVCLCDTSKLNDYENKYVISVFNFIFGNGSLTNKLFTNLREKNSLCYSVSSNYQRHDNMLIIHSGIDAKNKNKAVKLIDKSLKEMQAGKFNNDDVDNAIKTLHSSLKEAFNDQNTLVNNYFSHNMFDYPLLSEIIDNIDNVTKKDIVNLANKLKINLVYMMEGEADEGN